MDWQCIFHHHVKCLLTSHEGIFPRMITRHQYPFVCFHHCMYIHLFYPRVLLQSSYSDWLSSTVLVVRFILESILEFILFHSNCSRFFVQNSRLHNQYFSLCASATWLIHSCRLSVTHWHNSILWHPPPSFKFNGLYAYNKNNNIKKTSLKYKK